MSRDTVSPDSSLLSRCLDRSSLLRCSRLPCKNAVSIRSVAENIVKTNIYAIQSLICELSRIGDDDTSSRFRTYRYTDCFADSSLMQTEFFLARILRNTAFIPEVNDEKAVYYTKTTAGLQR